MLRSFAILPVFAALLIALMALPRYGLAWEVVDFSKPVPPGTIVINTPEHKLDFVLDGARPLFHNVGMMYREAASPFERASVIPSKKQIAGGTDMMGRLDDRRRGSMATVGDRSFRRRHLFAWPRSRCLKPSVPPLA